MDIKKLICLPTLLIALAAPSFVQASPGQLDKSFGKGGKVTTVIKRHGEVQASPFLAWAGGEKVIAAAGATLVEYLPDGRLDRGFGRHGRIRVDMPAGTSLQAVGMAVDSRGRIVLAGNVWPGTSVFVARYLSHGSPDPSFGQGGRVVTDLGLPAPPPPPGRGITYIPAVTEPSVEAKGLALDEADRPVLAGSWLSDWQFCYPSISDTPQLTGFVARLTVDGALDGAFGNGVVLPDPAKEVQASPLAEGGRVFAVGSLKNCLRGSPSEPELARLDTSGNLDRSFGSSGLASLDAYEAPDAAADRFGRVLLAGPGGPSGSTFLAQRFSAAGSPDKHFGEGGGKLISLPWGALQSGPDAVAVDQRGRPLFAFGAKRADESAVVVYRRRTSGAVDSGFGHRGQVSTHLETPILPTQILVGGNGKILVGGSMPKRSGYGLGLIRYLGAP
jgi:uncharacterized delta-60 repeat protein